MAEPATSDKFAQVRGFRIDIGGAGGKDVDTAWESVSGGELIIEHVETTIGSDKQHTHAPGHRSVGEITFSGAMTDMRSALMRWINDAQRGGPSALRDFSVTAVLQYPGEQTTRLGPTVWYLRAHPCGYRFGPLSARPAGNVHEEIRICAERLELR